MLFWSGPPLSNLLMYSSVIQHNDQKHWKQGKIFWKSGASTVTHKVLWTSFGARTKILFEYAKQDYSKCQGMEARRILLLLSVVLHLHVDRKILSLGDDVTQAGSSTAGTEGLQFFLSNSSGLAPQSCLSCVAKLIHSPECCICLNNDADLYLRDISNSADTLEWML